LMSDNHSGSNLHTSIIAGSSNSSFSRPTITFISAT
jgi:hypothetical protein